MTTHDTSSLIKISTQTGAATLIMSSILVLITSMTIIYGAQLGIIEQRISANDYRATQAYHAAQSGLDYALTDLDRYAIVTNTHINFDLSELAQQGDIPTGRYEVTYQPLIPKDYEKIMIRPTAYDKITVSAKGKSADDSATQHFEQVASFQSFLNYPPPAPIISQFGTNLSNNVTVVNNTPNNDIAIWAGELIDTNVNETIAPANILITETGGTGLYSDTQLAKLNSEQFFGNFFSLSKQAMQQNSQVIDCSTPCSASRLDINQSLIWIEGDLNLNNKIQLGTINRPLILIVNGKLSLANPEARIYGIVYVAQGWDNDAGAGQIQGSIIVEGAFFAEGQLTITYNNDVISNTAYQLGQYHYIPGTWKDF